MKPKRGTVREDGKIYWASCKGKEYWATPEKYQELCAIEKEKMQKRQASLNQKEKKHKRGDVREDGLIFWRYNASAKNGEHWISKEQLQIYKDQQNARSYKYVKNNKERFKAIQRKCYYKTRDKRAVKVKEYKIANRHRYNARAKFRRDTEPLYRCSKNIRDLVSRCFRERGYTKKTKTAQILGCSFEEFKTHLEARFLPGMSWENRGKWHIDHIMPVSMAKTYDEIVRLNHYRNLRPLWAFDNQSKCNKTPDTLVLF
jgi:hypothetical protein